MNESIIPDYIGTSYIVERDGSFIRKLENYQNETKGGNNTGQHLTGIIYDLR